MFRDGFNYEEVRVHSYICICVDLQRFNSNLLQEVHPLPKVDETLGQLAGAEAFIKFWQVALVEKSRLLTTFLTPFGRFCFNTNYHFETAVLLSISKSR